VSWTSSLIVPADSQESKYIFFSKEVIAMFVDAFAIRFPLPRGHSSHHRSPTTAGLWDPQTTCTSLIHKRPRRHEPTASRPKGLHRSLYLGNPDRLSVLQEHSAKEPPLTNVNCESSRVKPKQHSGWNHLRSRQRHGHFVFA
jgi:hypothetical protein